MWAKIADPKRILVNIHILFETTLNSAIMIFCCLGNPLWPIYLIKVCPSQTWVIWDYIQRLWWYFCIAEHGVLRVRSWGHLINLGKLALNSGFTSETWHLFKIMHRKTWPIWVLPLAFFEYLHLLHSIFGFHVIFYENYLSSWLFHVLLDPLSNLGENNRMLGLGKGTHFICTCLVNILQWVLQPIWVIYELAWRLRWFFVTEVVCFVEFIYVINLLLLLAFKFMLLTRHHYLIVGIFQVCNSLTAFKNLLSQRPRSLNIVPRPRILRLLITNDDFAWYLRQLGLRFSL
jgi:hypothetical protein